MASYAVLSTSSIVEDRLPFVGLRFLGPNVQIFDDVSSPAFKYTYSVVSPSPSLTDKPWYKFAISNASIPQSSGGSLYMGSLLLLRGDLPDTDTVQTYNLTLRAAEKGNLTSYTDILIVAQVPPPVRTSRYTLSVSDLTAPLETQQARIANKWFVDRFPPQQFYNNGVVLGKKDVLAIEVGSSGQPSARQQTFGDTTLEAEEYNFQGRRHQVAEFIPDATSTTFTASLYIPEDWIDAYPGSSLCSSQNPSNPDACARKTEFAVEFAASDGSTVTPTINIRAGFDNRDSTKVDVGPAPFLYLAFDGPIVGNAEWNSTVSGKTGKYAAYFPLKNPLYGWETTETYVRDQIGQNMLRRNDWNQFSFTVRRYPGDPVASTSRLCAETFNIEWMVNGIKHFLGPNTTIAASFCTRYPSALGGGYTTLNTNYARDIIVSAYNPPQNVSTVQQYTALCIVEDRLPFVGLRFLGPNVQIFDDVSSPAFKYTYSVVSPSPSLTDKPWYKFAISNASIPQSSGGSLYMGSLLLLRGDLPDTDTVQTYNLTLRAAEKGNLTSYTDILIVAQVPPPVRTSRYTLSVSDLTAPLETQQARIANKWFVDRFPPQQFYNNGVVLGKKDVLAIEVGSSGQPSARQQTFGDTTLEAEEYNFQGRRHQVAEFIPDATSTTFTASLYIPEDWIDAYPGSSLCSSQNPSNPDACARKTEFAVEFAASDGSTVTPTINIRAGFDNRDSTKVDVGPAPFLYLAFDGPIVGNAEWNSTVSGKTGKYAAYFPLKNPLYGWETTETYVRDQIGQNMLRRNDWNQFSFTVRRYPGDPVASTSRLCAETFNIEWMVNGIKHFLGPNTTIAASFCTRYPSALGGGYTTLNTNYARDIIVSAYNPPQNVSTVQQYTALCIVEDRLPFVGLRFLGPNVQIFDDVSSPAFKYTYSVVSPSPSLTDKPWYKFAISNASIPQSSGGSLYMGSLLLLRGDLPDTDTVQTYNLTLRAAEKGNLTSYTDILIVAQVPPPVRTSRYTLSVSDLTAPLETQQARIANKWFVDRFPPQQFYNNGVVLGKKDVLAIEVGSSGQPSARQQTFGDTTLEAEEYNFQGRRHQVAEFIPDATSTTFTASLYIPEDWIDAYPGSSLCSSQNPSNPDACARKTEFAVEFAASDGSTVTPTINIRAGFDNRDSTKVDVGPAPFLYLAFDGPIVGNAEWNSTVSGKTGKYAAYFPLKNPLYGWETTETYVRDQIGQNMLRRNDWNQFSFTVRRYPGDPVASTSRLCAETFNIEWMVNGIKHFLGPNTTIAASFCTRYPSALGGGYTTLNTNYARDIIVSAYNPPQNVSTVQQYTALCIVEDRLPFVGLRFLGPNVQIFDDVSSPAFKYTYSVVSPSPSLTDKPWYKFAISNASIPQSSGGSLYMGSLLLLRGDLPDTDTVQTYNLTLRAAEKGNLTSYTDILIVAQVPPPVRTSRYTLSVSDLTAPLETQQARIANKWFVDRFPPQQFYNNGVVLGKKDVLAIEVGSSGQPSARQQTFGDTTLEAEEYNFQGRRHQVAEFIPDATSTTFTASLYIPEDWIDAYPGSSLCSSQNPSNPDACARKTEFAVEFAASDGSTVTPTINIRAGFDNRDSTKVDVGPAPFLYLAFDGPIVGNAEWNSTVSGKTGKYAAYFPLKNPLYGWETTETYVRDQIGQNMLRRNDWNQFSFTVRRYPGDPVASTSRLCAETFNIEWMVNGIKHFLGPNTTIAASFCTRYPSALGGGNIQRFGQT
ncbi:hypothetical protein KSW81_004051 [Nannochloris sp. 'desiccata']|nr:hypothetical protein KSW81_004051 [Chlorella desiccata (nom. nud.)]